MSILPDDSILASGANPPKDRYRVVLTVGNNIDLAAVRLEALTHPSLPGNGPGRNLRGSFAQTSWNVTAASPDRKDPITLQFDHAWADQHEQTPGLSDHIEWTLEYLPKRRGTKLYGDLVDVKARLPRSGYDVDLRDAIQGME